MIDLLRDGPEDSDACFVFAHGAGAGMRSEWMQDFARDLAAHGVHVVRFEFPYMANRAEGQRAGGPDPKDVLIRTWKEVVAAVGGGPRVTVGGKSMGGRIASMIADDVGARGCVCLGYPFHPPKQRHVLRTAHLAQLRTPTLIVQGTRDPFGTPDEVAGYTLSPAIRVQWIDDGDHSLAPRKRSGHDPAQVMRDVIASVAAFVKKPG
ncbi:MAG TPA: alpha/beta fold hydrolase [Polyangiales bacterium]|nr:alpha/beta fold hydrolase [Polyangiales bacterium]